MILQSQCIFWGHLVLPYLSMLMLGEIKRLDFDSFSKLTSFCLIFRSVSFWFNIKSTAFWSILKTCLIQPQFQSCLFFYVQKLPKSKAILLILKSTLFWFILKSASFWFSFPKTILYYAPVKLFYPHPHHRGSHGVRGKFCVIKKGGTLEKRVIIVFI